MRVAFIGTPYPLEEAPAPPLGLSYAAAACERTGATVTIIDYIVRKYCPEKLTRELDAFGPDVVGTSSVTLNYYTAVEILQTAKAHDPDIITMMGGPHVSFDYEDTLRNYRGIDVVVIGEGEETLQELIPVIRERNKWKDIKGIAFLEGEELIVTEPRELIADLDTLPLPARHLLPMSRYQALGYPVSIITSRGCPNKCIFCQGRRMVGQKVRFRTISLVVDEIEDILSYGWTRINIADDLFTANKKRVIEFCNEVRKRGLRFGWSAFSRVNTADREVLDHMKDAGCDAVSFGIESGNPEMLKRIRKGITLDQAREAARHCKDAGMITHASFMVGLPGESRQTLEDTSAFAQELGIVYGYHLLCPFPGTTVRDEVDRYDLEILTNDWSKYDANRAIVRTSHLGPEEMEEFVFSFNDSLMAQWKVIEDLYWQGTLTGIDYLKVEGHYRTQLIYRLFNEDIIEGLPSMNGSGEPAEVLADKLASLTGMDSGIVNRTIINLSRVGFLKCRPEDGGLKWYWTHNNRLDMLPVSHP